jgi:hypothetical protein
VKPSISRALFAASAIGIKQRTSDASSTTACANGLPPIVRRQHKENTVMLVNGNSVPNTDQIRFFHSGPHATSARPHGVFKLDVVFPKILFIPGKMNLNSLEI